MERYIKVGKEFRTYVNQPLIASDVRAYKIVWDTKSDMTNMTLLVTAKRADGVMVTDTGTFKNGVGEYILAGNMYSVPGNVEIRVSILENTSVLTEKILVFEVLEGNNTDLAVGAETNTPVLNTLTVRITELYNLISNIPKKTSQLTNDSGYTTQEYVDNEINTLDERYTRQGYGFHTQIQGITERIDTVENIITVVENTCLQQSHNAVIEISGIKERLDNGEFVTNSALEQALPTKTSDLTNDSGFITDDQFSQQNSQFEQRLEFAEQDIKGHYENVNLEIGNVNGEITKVRNRVIAVENTLPTKTSQLTNDSNFISQEGAEEEFVKKEEGKGLSTADYHPIETIANIKTENGISNFNISKDTNNNAFKLDEIYIYINRPSELDANYTWSIYANNSQESNCAVVYGSPSKTLNTLSFHSQRLCEVLWQTEELQKNTSSGLTIAYTMKAVNYIKSLQLSLPGLPTGSTIIVCGRRVE